MKMKKYQLKYNNGTELLVLLKADILYDILKFIKYRISNKNLAKLSIWMDGKVLE